VSAELQETLRGYIRIVSEIADRLQQVAQHQIDILERQEVLAEAFALLLNRTSKQLLEQGIQVMLDEEIERQKRGKKPTPGGVDRKILQQ
jgi:hypothetical protein